MAKPFTVPAEGVVDYQYVRIDPGFKEDKWIKAVEVMPGDPAVVHHCNVFLQPPGVDDPKMIAEIGALGSVCVTQYVPGTADVKTGDLVVTSGIDGIYPKGFVIGTIEHADRGLGAYHEITVRPAADFARLEEVLIVRTPPASRGLIEEPPK